MLLAQASISRLSAASSQSEVSVKVSDGEQLLEVQALQDEIDLLIGQVRTIKARCTSHLHLRFVDLLVSRNGVVPWVAMGVSTRVTLQERQTEEDREEQRQQEVQKIGSSVPRVKTV